ncbi:unnamed protein product [Leptosia nina]|uniref:Uncharacterized protein n=1 Tax=Leptosia nina TaxID=320188 RepID=A0AAV1JE70_9NEOP
MCVSGGANDSGIGNSSRGKENVPSHKRARKALALGPSAPTATSTPHSHNNLVPDVCSFIIETPSKTLAGDESSELFSSPAIHRNPYLDESTSLHSLVSENTPDKYQNIDIENIISEKTKVSSKAEEPIVVKKSAVRSIKFDQEPEAKEETPSFIMATTNWETLACGKTQDQLDLTILAHQFLKKSALKPRSLNF